MGRWIVGISIVVGLFMPVATASAEPLKKPAGKAGCVTDPSSLVPNGTCELARAIDDVTDVEISPDGKFAYAAAYSSNSIAIFSRDAQTGKLTQLAGSDGCIAWDGDPITDCAQAHGLEGPTALAISPDGESVYVTTFQLNPTPIPPIISGQLLTFDRDTSTGALTETECASGSVFIFPLTPTPAPAGCSDKKFTGTGNYRNVPLSTASDVEVSPDGESVVTTSFLPSAVTNWDRNENTGALTPRECFASPRSIFPANGTSTPALLDSCTTELGIDTGGPAFGMGYPLDLEFSPDGNRVYAAALGLEQPATLATPAEDEAGSVAIFERQSNNALLQPGVPNGCVDDERDPVQPDTTCTHRTGLLNPYRVNVSPDSANFYVSSLNVFPPSGISGPGPGEFAQFKSDLSQLTPPCIQQLGLPAGGLEPTAACSLSAFGLILPSEVAFSPDGKSAYISSLFHSVGSYKRAANGTLTQDAPPTGCSVDPRHLLPGTELLGSVCQQTVPLDAPTSIELSPDGRDAYVTSGGFLTGNPNFGPQLASNKIVSDDAITQLSPIPPVPPEEPPVEPPVEPPAEKPTCGGAEATIVAAAGTLTRGTTGDDVIVGSDSGDRIKGRGGNDSICAGDGKDKVSGNGGNDKLKGGPGKDKLNGGSGNDKLNGGRGKDKLNGGPDKDRCRVKGNDRVKNCE